MKTINKLGCFIAIALVISSCNLDMNPIADFSEVNVGGTTSTGTTVKFKNKA